MFLAKPASLLIALSLVFVFSFCGCADEEKSGTESFRSVAIDANQIHEFTTWSEFEVRVAELPEGRTITVTKIPRHDDGYLFFLIENDGKISLMNE